MVERASAHENSWKFKSRSVNGRVIQKPDAQINATLGMPTRKKGGGRGREKSPKETGVETRRSGRQLHMINPHSVLPEQNAKSCCEYALCCICCHLEQSITAVQIRFTKHCHPNAVRLILLASQICMWYLPARVFSIFIVAVACIGFIGHVFFALIQPARVHISEAAGVVEHCCRLMRVLKCFSGGNQICVSRSLCSSDEPVFVYCVCVC